ncbi:MAG TPA: hypothetical protein VGR27_10435 [Longimicrobiaceae bacterium]|nr:hypothetical protein [Longimicrobiaceae bacterium]
MRWLRSAWVYFRRPTTTPGRGYSYHRLLLILGVRVWLYLWRPALPGATVEQ